MSPPFGSMRISKVFVRTEIRSALLIVAAVPGLLTTAMLGVSLLSVFTGGAPAGTSLGKSLLVATSFCALGTCGISIRDELPSSTIGG